MRVTTSFLTLMLSLEFKAPATNIVKDVVVIVKDAEAIALFIVCLISSN